MTSFWHFARQMLRYRATLIGAAIAAVLSAVCFGAGIATVPLILQSMLGTANTKSLVDVVTKWNDSLGAPLPAVWIKALPTDPFRGIVVVLVAVLVLTIIGATAKYLHTLLAMTAAIRAVANIRKAAFYRIIHFPMRSVVAEGMIDSISRVVRDSNILNRGFMAITSKTVGEILKGIAALTVAIMLDWKMSIVALVSAPILAGSVRYFSTRVKDASREVLARAAQMLATITQSVQGIRVVKVHTAERIEAGRFNRVNKQMIEAEMSIRATRALASPVVELITMIGIVVIAGITAWYILHGAADRTQAISALFALGAAGASVRPITQLSTEIHESAAAADRLKVLLDTEVETSRHERRPRLAPHATSIEFADVTFTYPNATHPAINGITLTIRHGEVVAFVGPNGCGKTTLLSLIPRLFEPDSGCVLVDDVNIADVSLRSLREQIGVVTQETVLFDDTIRNNIAYGSGPVSDAEIETAARGALAHEFITDKPQGYDTIVGEQGVTLSGGQRQRLAIARAMLRNPRMLILDEATSMIDADSEAQINAVLEKFWRRRTSFVIAHRLSTVVNADRIVVMDAGRIVDVGSHDDLLARCTLYQQLCRTQLSGSPVKERALAT